MNKIILLLSLLVITSAVYAQTTDVNYNTNFYTNDQNLWQQGTTGLFEIHQNFFDLNWNQSKTIGGITSVAGYKFGAKVTAGTWGTMASGLDINFGTEKVDVQYNTSNVMKKPTDLTFDPGDNITIKTGWQPTNTDIVVDQYNVNMELWLKFGMGINLNTEVCVFDCADISIVDIDLPVKKYELASISSLNGVSLLEGLYSWPASDAFPLEFSDAQGITSTSITLPDNSGANIYLDANNNLHSYADPSDPYFNFYFSLPKFIGALHIPYVSAFFANLSNSYELWPFYLNYTLMESGFNLGLYHKQHLVFEPTIKGKFKLAAEVDYQVVDPSNGQIKAEGYGNEINYTVGDNVKIDFPCNYDFMDVTPSFYIENEFNNHTYDSIAMDFIFDMLSFDFGIEPVEVIPAYCTDIPYPCPTWSNPLRICWKEVCTPAVGFSGMNYNFGPLVHWQPNLFNIKYDWCDNSWAMEGFNSYENMDPFRLEPRTFDVKLTANDILCSGEKTGSATATVTNGTPPYTYQWSNGTVVTTNDATNTQTNLESGTHYVIVHDAGECTVFDSKVIVQPDEPLELSATVTDPNCFNSLDGSIITTTTGGTPNYSYNWSNGATTESISGVDAGTYSLTLTDDNGCIVTKEYTLTKPDELVSNPTVTDVACNGETSGSIYLNISGGTLPYSYSWSDGNVSNYEENLPPATYYITTTDFNNCINKDTITINQPSQALSASDIITDVACYGGSTGQIDITATGGTSPYYYEWLDSNGAIISQYGATLQGVSIGEYSLILTDKQNCKDTIKYVINQPDSLSYDVLVSDVLCFGGNSGAINLNLSGATLPYSYLWSNGSTSEDLNNAYYGDYSVTITDDNNCIYMIEAFIDQPEEALSASTTKTDALCYGGYSGSISVSAEGGTSPYNYLWSNGATEPELPNVPIGTYTVTVTDANNCEAYSGAVISQPDSIFISSQINDISCFGYSDGSIQVEIDGGTLPYRLIWDDNTYQLSSNQQTIENLLPGEYNIIVKDDNNCYSQVNYVIGSPDSVVITLTPTIVSCYEGSDGTITSSISGGTSPFVYEWENGSSADVLSNIPAGTYILKVTDDHNCVYIASTEVPSYSEIIVESEVEAPSCRDKENGYIVLTVTGGLGNYIYEWSNGENVKDIFNLAPGVYSVNIYDENNCKVEDYFDIPYVYNGCLMVPSTFSPNNDGINDTWVISGIEEYSDANVKIFNSWGNLIYESVNEYIPWDGTYNGKAMPSGTYYYILNLNNGVDAPSNGTVTIVR